MGVSDWLQGRLQDQLQARRHGRPSHRLQDPFYRFQSIEELQRAAALGVRLDVNRADIDDWLRLPGLSIHQARILVSLSQAGVAFHCLEDLAAALGLPVQRLQPLAAILQFCYYDPDAVPSLNPNTASVKQLLSLPGMDRGLAQKIVENRHQQGSYRNLVDFQQRLQLSSQTLSEWMHYLRISV